VHPVTKEFNHKAVIKHRGGRFTDEVIGSTEIFYQFLSSIHALTAPNV